MGIYENYEKKSVGQLMNEIIEETCRTKSTLTGNISSGYSYGSMFRYNTQFAIEKVIFNDPATIVCWKDGTKTVVKTQNNEVFDAEKGLAMAIAKKALGNKGNYYNVIKEHADKHPYEGPTLEEYEKIYKAYKVLTDNQYKGRNVEPFKADMGIAMEEAIGYLGEVLDV